MRALLRKSYTKWCFCWEFKEEQWFSEGELPNLHRIYMHVWFLYSYGIFIYMEILVNKWISHRWLLSGLHTLWEVGQPVAWTQGLADACGSWLRPGDRIHGFPQETGFRGEKSRKWVKIQDQEDPILEKSIICIIRVRGFPLRDILSLRALGDGLGQGRKIVGASPPPPPSASLP